MAYGVLLLRLVLGLTLAAHGAQKLFGVFGGAGPRGTARTFAGFGYRASLPMALAAGVAELGGGVLVAAGLLTPVGSFALAVAMLNAIFAAQHYRNGFWNSRRGFEYELLIWTAAVALAATGGARFSLDALVGWTDTLSGLGVGAGVAAASAVAAALTLTLGRSHRREEPARPAA
jgi:putative oxidoreductase